MEHVIYMAVEGGGTYSRAKLYDVKFQLLTEAEGKPCNPVAYGIETCVQNLSDLLNPMLKLHMDASPTLLLGTAGGGEVSMRQALGESLLNALPIACVRITTDLHPLLLANTQGQPGMLVVAGTGSAVLGVDTRGEFHRLGGRGMLFGDFGSAYQLAADALRSAAMALDGIGVETSLTTKLLKALGLDTWAEAVVVAGQLPKDRLAELARTVIAAAEEDDYVSGLIVKSQARGLVKLIKAMQDKLDTADTLTVFLQGGLLSNANHFQKCFLQELGTIDTVKPGQITTGGPESMLSLLNVADDTSWLTVLQRESGIASLRDFPESPTEGITSAPALDSLSLYEMLHQMHLADQRAVSAVGECLTEIAALVSAVAERFDTGGRILYIGAGTSGRLGVLDASECPPTFGVAQERVLGIIAGGEAALRYSIEGAEDDSDAGQTDIVIHDVDNKDCVIGLAASGRTPYVHAALKEAKSRDALTALVSCNPGIITEQGFDYIDYNIGMNSGAEVLAGSTRLKAGTATKLVLNMISTSVLTLHGLVYQGRMVGMRAVNKKLRCRARQIVADLGVCSTEQAQYLLEQTDYNIAQAIVMARHDVEAAVAKEYLLKAQGKLRYALGKK